MNFRKVVIVILIAVMVLPMALVVGGIVRDLFKPRYDVEALTRVEDRIEMAKDSGPEWVVIHHPAEKGKPNTADVLYRSGARGVRFYEPNQNGYPILRGLKVFAPNRDLLADLKFGPDGKQIVGGFERRFDGTMLREADMRADGIVVLTTYWQDGVTRFAVEERGVEADDMSAVYYHPNGSIWLEQEFTALQYPKVALREVAYDAQGKRVHTRTNDTAGLGNMIYYRADGETFAYTQTIAVHERVIGTEYGESTQRDRVVRAVTVYDEYNKPTKRYVTVPDGSAVDSIEYFDANGDVTRREDTFDTDFKLPAIYSGWEAHTNPFKVWEAQEAKVITGVR